MVRAGANNDQRIFGQVPSRKTRPTRARRVKYAIVMNPSDFHIGTQAAVFEDSSRTWSI